MINLFLGLTPDLGNYPPFFRLPYFEVVVVVVAAAAAVAVGVVVVVAAVAVVVVIIPPRWCLHFIVVRGFEYVSDPESYTSSSVATGRASLAGQVKG